MTVNGVRRRTRKKRRLVEIIDHAHRLDAIFPELQDNDEQFLQLIMLIWVLSENGSISMTKRRYLAMLFKPALNLRSDDMRFVSHRLMTCGISDSQVKWLCEFMVSSFAGELRTRLVEQLNGIAADAGTVTMARQRQVLQYLGQTG